MLGSCVRDREARADGQGRELIDRVAAGAPVRQLLLVEALGHTRVPFARHRPDHRAGVKLATVWMKTRGGWSETSTHKHTGTANGYPIEVDVVTVRERLTRRIARIAAARTTGDVPETDE
jgi:hypothetical protein